MLGLASLKCTITRQRSRIVWLMDGDANTMFFHIHVSIRHRATTSFDGVVASASPLPRKRWSEHSINLSALNLSTIYTSLLELHFSEDEIWRVIKEL